MKCYRCDGIMIYEKFYGLYEHFWGWKCLLCGEIVDEVIMENRNGFRPMMGKWKRSRGKNQEKIK